MTAAYGTIASDAVARIERLLGWRIDVDVVSAILSAVNGDLGALEQAVGRAGDPTDLLIRPHRPLDVLAAPTPPAGVVTGHDDAAIRLALVYALAEDDIDGVTSVLATLDEPESTLAAALDAHLLRRAPSGPAVTDNETAAALWHGASEEQRTWALDSLAEHTEDPEARIWYRAWAATGPDGELSGALVGASELALARGRGVDAASALEIAAALSPDHSRSVRFILRAAEIFFVAGRPRHALALLRRTVDRTVDPASAAMMHRMIGRVLMFDGDLRAAEAHLLAHATPIAGGDPDLGMLLAAEALWVRAVDGRLAEALPLITEHGPPGEDAPTFVKSCWTGLRNMLGTGVERAELEERHAEFSSMGSDDPETSMVGYVILHAAIGMEAFDIAHEVLSTLVHREVREGAVANRALILAGASELAWWQGEWPAARSWAHEAIDLAQRQRDTISPARAVLTLARIQYASEESAEAEALVDDHLGTVPGWSRPALLAVRGHGHLVAGRFDRAIADLAAAVEAETQPGSGLPHPKLSAVGPDYCGALVATGRLDDARFWLERWRNTPSATGRWERGAARRCDALLSTGRDAIVAGGDAAELLEGFAFEQARALVELGDRQFEAGDFGGAQTSLRAALPRFVGLGATTWTKSTESRLERVAGQGAFRFEHEFARLSDQDRRIARCVVAGSTNRQVAEELHLSPKTVENRLTAIYATLGLRNRVDLARHLNR